MSYSILTQGETIKAGTEGLNRTTFSQSFPQCGQTFGGKSCQILTKKLPNSLNLEAAWATSFGPTKNAKEPKTAHFGQNMRLKSGPNR